MDAIKAKRLGHPNEVITIQQEMKMASTAIEESAPTQGADMAAIAYQLLNQPSPVQHKDTAAGVAADGGTAASSIIPTTLVMGDFNLCSHLDWNGSVDVPSSSSLSSSPEKQSKEWICSPPREYGLHCPVAWPVSTKLHAHGFEDTYRVVNTDARSSPGYTWPALTEKEMGFPALDDRIDFIYVRPPTQTYASAISPLASSSSSTTAATAVIATAAASASQQRLGAAGITITGARRIGADVGDWPVDDIKGWPSDHYAVSISLTM